MMEDPIQDRNRKRRSVHIRTFFSNIFQSSSLPTVESTPSPTKSASFFSLPKRTKSPYTKPTSKKRRWMSQPYLLEDEENGSGASSSGGEGGKPGKQDSSRTQHPANRSSPSLTRPRDMDTSKNDEVVALTQRAGSLTNVKVTPDVTPVPAESPAIPSVVSSLRLSPAGAALPALAQQHARQLESPNSSLNDPMSSSQAAMMSAMQSFPSLAPRGPLSFPLSQDVQRDAPTSSSTVSHSSHPPSVPQRTPSPLHEVSENVTSSPDIILRTASEPQYTSPIGTPRAESPPILTITKSRTPSPPIEDVASRRRSTTRPSTAPSSGLSSPPPGIFSPSKNTTPSSRGMRLSLSRRPGPMMGLPPPLITPAIMESGITEEDRTPPRERAPTSPLLSPSIAGAPRRRPQTAQARLKSVPSLARHGVVNDRQQPESPEDDEDGDSGEDGEDDGDEDSDNEDEAERSVEPPLSPISITRRPPPLLTSKISSLFASPPQPTSQPTTPVQHTSPRTPRAGSSGTDYFSLDRSSGKISRPSTAGTVHGGETTPRLGIPTPVATPRIPAALKTPKIMVTPMTPIERDRPSISRLTTRSLIDIPATLNEPIESNILPESTGLSRTGAQGDPPNYHHQHQPELRRRRSSLPPSSSPPPPPYPLLARLLHPHQHPPHAPISTEPDVLPQYTNEIFMRQTIPRKMEFTGPGIQARDRKWRRVTCELEGTVLRVYKKRREGWWERKIGVGDSSDTTNPVPASKAGANNTDATPSAPGDSPVVKDGERPNGGTQTELLVVPNSVATTTPPGEERRSRFGKLVSAGRKRISSSGSLTHSRTRSEASASNSAEPRIVDAGRSSLALPRGSVSSTSSREPSSSDVSRPGSSPVSFDNDDDQAEDQENDEDLELIRAYSLQNAESGLGNDYIKRRNVIRVRCEGEQFLLQVSNVADVVEWIEKLHMGADVSLDLDERPMPRGPLFPRRRRRRRARAATGTTNSNNNAGGNGGITASVNVGDSTTAR